MQSSSQHLSSCECSLVIDMKYSSVTLLSSSCHMDVVSDVMRDPSCTTCCHSCDVMISLALTWVSHCASKLCCCRCGLHKTFHVPGYNSVIVWIDIKYQIMFAGCNNVCRKLIQHLPYIHFFLSRSATFHWYSVCCQFYECLLLSVANSKCWRRIIKRFNMWRPMRFELCVCRSMKLRYEMCCKISSDLCVGGWSCIYY